MTIDKFGLGLIAAGFATLFKKKAKKVPLILGSMHVAGIGLFGTSSF